jgi:SAM-dependent methyltransferase
MVKAGHPSEGRVSGGALRRQRAARALQRQLAYQREKAGHLVGQEARMLDEMRARSTQVRTALEVVRPVLPDDRLLEVGSGAHGLVFQFGCKRSVGCDPLAAEYATLFPWQRLVPTLTARGEELPFPDGAFDIVLCDNVADHAEDPAAIVAELVRVLAPGGVLYFAVNVHHPMYALFSRLQRALDALAIPLVVGPFADHTVHLTPAAARQLFAGRAIVTLLDHYDVQQAKASARRRRLRHPGDFVKRVFFKNARFQIVAIR